MAFWNQDDEGEWEKYRKSREKESQEPEEKKMPPESNEFREYFKIVRQAQSPESGEAEQPGEKASPLQTFLSRFRGDEKSEEPEGPPEKCPWCGGDMVKGYLSGARGMYWRSKKPTFLSTNFSTDVVVVFEPESHGFTTYTYKIVWHCPACFKMVTDIRDLNSPLGERKPNQYGLGSNNSADVEESGENGADGPENETEET